MSDYTPSTDEVRRAAVCELVVTAAQFYRWLAAHDATVRADHEKAVRERIAQELVRELGDWRAADIVREGA